MLEMEKALEKLAATAERGAYYRYATLYKKVDDLLEKYDVKRFWRFSIQAIESDVPPERKTRLLLEYQPVEEELAKQALLDGRYVLETTVDKSTMSTTAVQDAYKALNHAERSFRHIKSFLKIRPMYHRIRPRIRAHVLICFLAYYLVKQCELLFRSKGDGREVEKTLRRWDQLCISRQVLTVGEYSTASWNWQLGEMGCQIQQEMKALGVWKFVARYRHSLLPS